MICGKIIFPEKIGLLPYKFQKNQKTYKKISPIQETLNLLMCADGSNNIMKSPLWQFWHFLRLFSSSLLLITFFWHFRHFLALLVMGMGDQSHHSQRDWPTEDNLKKLKQWHIQTHTRTSLLRD